MLKKISTEYEEIIKASIDCKYTYIKMEKS